MFMCSVPSLRTFLKYKMVEMYWNNTKYMNCVLLFELFSLVGEKPAKPAGVFSQKIQYLTDIELNSKLGFFIF